MDHPKIAVLNVLTTFFSEEFIESNSAMIVGKIIP